MLKRLKKASYIWLVYDVQQALEGLQPFKAYSLSDSALNLLEKNAAQFSQMFVKEKKLPLLRSIPITISRPHIFQVYIYI